MNLRRPTECAAFYGRALRQWAHFCGGGPCTSESVHSTAEPLTIQRYYLSDGRTSVIALQSSVNTSRAPVWATQGLQTSQQGTQRMECPMTCRARRRRRAPLANGPLCGITEERTGPECRVIETGLSYSWRNVLMCSERGRVTGDGPQPPWSITKLEILLRDSTLQRLGHFR